MFENVTYTFYSSTLGRAIVPDETTFDSYKLENEQFIKANYPFIQERETNGIDSAVCMMIEVDYVANKNKTADGRIETSRSLDGFSQSFDLSRVKSVGQKKRDWIKAFCEIPEIK